MMAVVAVSSKHHSHCDCPILGKTPLSLQPSLLPSLRHPSDCRQLAAAEGRLLHAEERVAGLGSDVESLHVSCCGAAVQTRTPV